MEVTHTNVAAHTKWKNPINCISKRISPRKIMKLEESTLETPEHKSRCPSFPSGSHDSSHPQPPANLNKPSLKLTTPSPPSSPITHPQHSHEYITKAMLEGAAGYEIPSTSLHLHPYPCPFTQSDSTFSLNKLPLACHSNQVLLHIKFNATSPEPSWTPRNHHLLPNHVASLVLL